MPSSSDTRSPRVAAALALWLGAAVLFTVVVAPAAFAVLPSRALAGALVGRILPVLFWSGAMAGILAMVALRGSSSLRGWRGAMGLLLILVSLGAQLGVAPRIQRVRESLGTAIEMVDPSDPRRQEFGRLHGISVLLLGVGMVAAAAMMLGGLMPSERARKARANDPSAVAGLASR
jgi:hypothetical protein